MKRFILTAIVLFTLIQTHGKGSNGDTVTNNNNTLTSYLKGNKFALEYQVFESHDKAGIDIDTVHHKGDYILFANNGMAYINFDGKPDSIRYTFPDKNSVSFGDTPFTITNLGNGFFKLLQNEAKPDGDYNKATYLLKRETLMVANIYE